MPLRDLTLMTDLSLTKKSLTLHLPIPGQSWTGVVNVLPVPALVWVSIILNILILQ